MKKILSFTIVAGLTIFLVGCSYNTSIEEQNGGQALVDQKDSAQVGQSEVEITKTKNESIGFVDSLLNKLPDTYIISEVEYFESLNTESRKATEVKPCDDKNLEPIYSPLCFTKLTIVEQEKTDNLDEYIKTNKVTSWYESALSTKLVKATYQENIPYVYTPKFFMCLGTGAESCMRKNFVYHLVDGRNILVEISYWPFENGEHIVNPSEEVQDIIKVYEDLLTK